MNARTPARTHRDLHTHARTRARARTHARTHAPTHAHAHTHTHTRSIGVMWADLVVVKMSLAAFFCTFRSLERRYLGQSAKRRSVVFEGDVQHY